MEAVQPLAEIAAQRKELQAQLSALDASYSEAYVNAQRNGWTDDELTRIGAEEPNRRRPGRPRKQTGKTKSTRGKSTPAKTDSGSTSAGTSNVAPGEREQAEPAGSAIPEQVQGPVDASSPAHS